ncbi:MAG TPA: M1 family aminopeptidase [Pyrinomonadaceae bacterium]|nr:M1 family aminopeptidase [Pyrinomonadaceae bacterium]
MTTKPLSSHPRLACLLFLVVSIVAAPLTAAIPRADFSYQLQQQSSSRPLPPAQYIPAHDFDTRHIALDLRFDWDREQVIGVEKIVFAPLIADLDKIELDAANMIFSSVALADGKKLNFTSDDEKEKLNIILDRIYQPAEELTIIISYNTNRPQKRRLGSTGTGIRFIKPSADDPNRPKQIWTQGESEYNHYWFPCYDHPNDFFTSEITATVEKPLSLISNGKLLETVENNDGSRKFHWKMDQSHASYLSSIIVGEYIPIASEYAGIPIVSNVYPNEVDEGKLSTARLTEMVKFFSEKTGVRYPYAKYAQTMVRDFGGGMENISATTQTDNMIHDARTELDHNSDGLQAHELAHQWFGDYVTSRSWSDIWLNESFATYFQAMWDEYKLGRDDFLYSDVKANQDSYLNTWKQGNRRPIVTRNYASPDAVFDTYAYPVGGAVLHMLRKSLGEKNWWRAINYYLSKYAHQPVETEQFRIAIEESTGRPMDWFFEEWLYKMGHPVFRVTQDYDAANKVLKLTVEQQQKPDPDSQFPQVSFFQTPVEIEISTAAGTRIERVKIEPKKEQSFTFAVDSKPLLVNFDYNGTLIKEIEFNKTKEELVYQLSHDEDVLGRLWAMKELSALMNKEATAETNRQLLATELARVLVNDKFWGMRLEAADALSAVKGEATRNALLAASKDQNSRVRARAIMALSSSKDAALATLYKPFLEDQSYDVIRAASRALGQSKAAGAYESLTKLLDKSSWRDTIRASALEGLAALEDSRALNTGFRYSGPGNQPQVRAAALKLLSTTGKNDPRVFPLLAESIKQGFEKFDFDLMFASAEALVNLGDPRGLVVLDELAKTAGDLPQLQGAISEFQNRLRKMTAGVTAKPATQP